GLVVDSQGNVDFAGIIGTVDDPSNVTLPLFGQLDAAGDAITWRGAFNNPSQAAGGGMTAVALDPQGNVVFIGSGANTGTAGNPLNQDLLIGRAKPAGKPDGTVDLVDAFRWYVDPRDGSPSRSGDWQASSLVVLADGSSIVGGAAYDLSAGSNSGDPASIPT